MEDYLDELLAVGCEYPDDDAVEDYSDV